MENNQAGNLIGRIDELLDEAVGREGKLDDETVDDLVEMLTPGASEPWPDLEAVLHLAEHEAIAEDLKHHAVADRLEQAIGEALEAVFPLLDIRPYGPTFKLVEIVRRRLDAESEKFELVSKRLEELDYDERVETLGRYLNTEPAPMFVNRFRQLYPEALPEADETRETDEDVRAALDELVERLEELREEDVPVLEAVHRIAESFEGSAQKVASLGLTSNDPHEQLVGGALMVEGELDDLLPTAFRRVMDGSPGAPILAVLTGQMAPKQSQHAYSTFIAEVSWQNPEMPEAEMTPARICAILSARAVLPKLGSPMDPIGPEDVPDDVEDAETRQIPETVNEAWEIWGELTGA